MEKFTYSAEALSDLHDESALRFLCEVGLPVDHLLFGFAEPVLRRVGHGGVERKLIRIGEGGDREEFCVDARSGEVVAFVLSGNCVWHVNESPEKFFNCLELFLSRVPFNGADSDLEERESAAASLKDAIMKIDGTAFDKIRVSGTRSCMMWLSVTTTTSSAGALYGDCDHDRVEMDDGHWP